MDAVKFMKEFQRMCRNYRCCVGCPRQGKGCSLEDTCAEELVLDVVKWSKEHPRKTRKQDFLEKYPNAKIEADGTPKACCADLGYCEECIQEICEHVGCEGCWDDYLEDDE